MIVLDTNVISEMTKQAPSPAVEAWLDAQPRETLFITAITIAEMGLGIATMPEGRRRVALEDALAGTSAFFADRILSFDERAARAFINLASLARNSGRGLPTPDGYIAAIAAAHGYAVAKRDTAPFIAGGVNVINPWDFAA